MWNHTGNIILHKDDVGKPKPPCTRLPPADYVYGNPTKLADDGVRELINNWTYHKATQDSEPSKDYLKVNRKCLSMGAFNAKDFRTYSKQIGDTKNPPKGRLEICNI